MTKVYFQARQLVREYCQTINAPPNDVFPLLCPVREAEWLDGWRYTMLYSRSGLVEEGAVFSTLGKDEPDTVWVVTSHNPANYQVEFARFTHQSRTCVLKIAVRPTKKSTSCVDISYTYTGISPAGNGFIEKITDEIFQGDMKFWEDSMNHFLLTGEKLKRG